MREPNIDKALPKDWSDALPVLKQWCDELKKRQEGHRIAARKYRLLNRVLGGLNVILAAITATAMFAALNKKLDNLTIVWQVVITGLAVLPAVATGLQKEWQVLAREHGHVALAQDCRVLLKELEFDLAFPPSNFRDTITAWHQRYRDVITRPTVAALRSVL